MKIRFRSSSCSSEQHGSKEENYVMGGQNLEFNQIDNEFIIEKRTLHHKTPKKKKNHTENIPFLFITESIN